jgi:hypothetical protein
MDLSMSRYKWLVVAVVGVLALGYGTLSYFMGGPRDAYGFLRYALPQWRDGDLKVGDRAPDARLVSLDGRATFHIRDRIGAKPLVLVFGSYT